MKSKTQNFMADYKQSEIGRIPERWEVARLGAACETIKSGGTPLTSKKDFYGGTIKFVKIEDLTNSDKYLSDTLTTITDNGLANSNAWLVPEGSVLIGIYGSLGATAINKVKVATNQAILGVITDRNRLTSEFLYYYFLNSKNKFLRQAKHTTQANLTLAIIENLKLLLPPLTEQKRIVEVLSTVDTAIQKVDNAIKKTERLKRGLMQRLLTRGISPKKFKDSEIGRVPEGWQVVKLEQVISEIKNGFASGKRDENGIVQIRMNNVTTDGRLILDSYLKVPTPNDTGFWLLKKGDLLFNNTNSIDLVGKSTIFSNAPFPCTFSNHFTRIRFKAEVLLSELVLYHFILLWEKGYFKSVAIRHVGQSAVNPEYLLKLKLPLPPLAEQKKIVEIMGAVDEKLGLEHRRKEKLERVKKGLMDDLLTGKKRVLVRSS